MKKTIYALFTGLLLCLGMSHIVQADEYLRIGMEAAYAPFNWTQMEPLRLMAPTNMPTDTMFKSPKKLLRD